MVTIHHPASFHPFHYTKTTFWQKMEITRIPYPSASVKPHPVLMQCSKQCSKTQWSKFHGPWTPIIKTPQNHHTLYCITNKNTLLALLLPSHIDLDALSDSIHNFMTATKFKKTTIPSQQPHWHNTPDASTANPSQHNPRAPTKCSPAPPIHWPWCTHNHHLHTY